MEPFFKVYTLCWISACIWASVLLVRDRAKVDLFRPAYWRFLAEPWRFVTFTIACLSMTVIAPYTGDPTWDYADAFFMSSLTFLTAPWAVGTLYNAARRRRKISHAFIAACLWMFSASWSYDIYLVARDGSYPQTWSANIFASSVLYAAAGLFWNLDWIRGRGATFAFTEGGWPYAPSGQPFRKIVWYALPFMALVSFLILYFFWFNPGL